MNDKVYKEALDNFKNSCKIYNHEKECIRLSYFDDPMLEKFMKEDVEYVEKILSDIEEKYGKQSRNMIFALCVDDRTQVDVAYEFNLSRRQLQYAFKKIMQDILLTGVQR